MDRLTSFVSESLFGSKTASSIGRRLLSLRAYDDVIGAETRLVKVDDEAMPALAGWDAEGAADELKLLLRRTARMNETRLLCFFVCTEIGVRLLLKLGREVVSRESHSGRRTARDAP